MVYIAGYCLNGYNLFLFRWICLDEKIDLKLGDKLHAAAVFE